MYLGKSFALQRIYGFVKELNWICYALSKQHPVDTGHKLNVHKTFNLRPESTRNIEQKVSKKRNNLDNLKGLIYGSFRLIENVYGLTFSICPVNYLVVRKIRWVVTL